MTNKTATTAAPEADATENAANEAAETETTETTALAVVAPKPHVHERSKWADEFFLLDKEPSELIADITESLGGEATNPGMFIDTVSLPTGEGGRYALPGQETKTESFKALIIGNHMTRAYYATAFNGEVVPPDCSSPDGKHGFGLYGIGSEVNPLGSCAQCPMSKLVEGPNGKKKGAPCRSKLVVYALLPDRVFPIKLMLPPTSQRQPKNDANGFYALQKEVLNHAKPVHGTVVEVGLRPEQTGTGRSATTYQIATFKILGYVTRDEANRVKAFAAALDQYIKPPTMQGQDGETTIDGTASVEGQPAQTGRAIHF